MKKIRVDATKGGDNMNYYWKNKKLLNENGGILTTSHIRSSSRTCGGDP
jgi:hypothetical protein